MQVIEVLRRKDSVRAPTRGRAARRRGRRQRTHRGHAQAQRRSIHAKHRGHATAVAEMVTPTNACLAESV